MKGSFDELEATRIVVKEKGEKTVLHHYHYGCGEQMLIFLQKNRGSRLLSEGVYSDMYFDSEEGALRSHSAWLRFRCYPDKKSWRLVFKRTEDERVRDTDEKVEYEAIDDEAEILTFVNRLCGNQVKDLEDLSVVAKFSFHRTSLETDNGTISVDEVRCLPYYFWICTVSIRNPDAEDDPMLILMRNAPVGVGSPSKVCTCLNPEKARLLGVQMNSEPYHDDLQPKGYVYEDSGESVEIEMDDADVAPIKAPLPVTRDVYEQGLLTQVKPEVVQFFMNHVV